jgi:hypothetical protein
MSKESFAEWLDDQPYYVGEEEYRDAQDCHGVNVTLPKGITVWSNNDCVVQIPSRDIRHGEWIGVE